MQNIMDMKTIVTNRLERLRKVEQTTEVRASIEVLTKWIDGYEKALDCTEPTK